MLRSSAANIEPRIVLVFTEFLLFAAVFLRLFGAGTSFLPVKADGCLGRKAGIEA
jgi:hypothetical protein